MKTTIHVAIITLTTLSATTAAQIYLPPANGIYKSSDLPGGTLLTGYFSESWVAPDFAHGRVGNTINARSWDEMNPATEWKLWCASIAAPPVLVSDARDGNGSGEVTWQANYMGGYYWLSKDGPWSDDNLIDFTGTVVDLKVTTTYQFAFGELIGIRGNVTLEGHFDQLDPSWDEACFLYEINNIAFYGTTDDAAKPPEFPAFINPTACPSEEEGLTQGGWGDVTHITLVIRDCTVPAANMTWGAVKALYCN